jgi:glycosyltransferase involved in cell wall biosynthesis
VKVAIVAEFYPRAADPVLGIWAHRQAVAARDAGADVRVLVLHRPVPPRADPSAKQLRTMLAQPRHDTRDGIDITYVPFLAPPRPRTYGSWGTYAAPSLGLALRRLRRRFPFDLVHAHNAVPAGDAVRRARIRQPLVVSVHGGDVYFTAPRYPKGRRAIERTFAEARLVLANSSGIEDAARKLKATDTRVIHLGTDIPANPAHRHDDHTLVTVAHLVERKRHADVIRALWSLRDSHPALRYEIIGDGPERERLQDLAGELEVQDRVVLHGQLPHDEALARARQAHAFVMPSTDEAFGVAYIEAMAGCLPAIGCLGEPGPQDIASAGEGIRLVPPGDVEALAGELRALLDEPRYLHDMGNSARATVEEHFTWEACGRATVAAYEDALR